jgi:hypothetical protein
MGGWLAILGSSVWIGERKINILTGVRIADEVNPDFRGQNQVITCHSHKSWF